MVPRVAATLLCVLHKDATRKKKLLLFEIKDNITSQKYHKP